MSTLWNAVKERGSNLVEDLTDEVASIKGLVKDATVAGGLKAIETGVSEINKSSPYNTIDDLAYNIMTEHYDTERDVKGIATATTDWLAGTTTDWDAIKGGGGNYIGFLPHYHARGTGTDEWAHKEPEFDYLAPLNSDGEPVDIISIYLQREDNNLDVSEHSLYDEVDHKGNKIFNNLLQHYEHHPSMDSTSTNTAYSIKEFSDFKVPKVIFQSSQNNQTIKGSGDIIGTGQDVTYSEFKDYYDRVELDIQAKYGDLSYPEQLEIAKTNDDAVMWEFLDKVSAVNVAFNNFHNENLIIRDTGKDGIFQEDAWIKQKSHPKYLDTRNELRYLLKDKNPIRWDADQGDWKDGMSTSEMRGVDPIFHYETSVDIAGHNRILNYDHEKDQYYYAVIESWDFINNERAPSEKLREFSDVFDDIKENKWKVSEQFEDIVNAAGKPIPIYDRYYLSDDEMQGVLNYYQLDMDGNETTVIDDHVKYQSDTYNEEYFNNLEDMETLKGGYK